MSEKRGRFFWTAILSTLLGCTAIPASGQENIGEAKGVNPKDNITKTEIILRYDSLDISDYTKSMTFKYDRAFDERWGGNVEIPLVGFSGFGSVAQGLGDIQARLRFSDQIGAGTIVLGAEAVFPTASDETLGRGWLQLNPAVGYVVSPAPNTFIYMGYKHYFSVAGDSDRAGINESQPRLIAGYTSSDGWWLLGDLKYTTSWESDLHQLDLEVEYGRMIGSATGIWARTGTSALDSDRQAMILVGVRFFQ